MNSKVMLTDKSMLDLMKVIVEKKVVNVRHFLISEYNMNYTRYLKKLPVIKERYPDIYEEYEKELNKNFSLFKEDVKTVFLSILLMKKNGIKLNDNTYRKFDLFDFYNLKNKYFNDFNKKELIPIYEELIREIKYEYIDIDFNDLRIMINYTLGNSSFKYDSIDLLICKEIIYNNNDELTMKEKEFLVSFMEKNNIPFTLGNYNFGMKKLLRQRNGNNNLFNLSICIDGKRGL